MSRPAARSRAAIHRTTSREEWRNVPASLRRKRAASMRDGAGGARSRAGHRRGTARGKRPALRPPCATGAQGVARRVREVARLLAPPHAAVVRWSFPNFRFPILKFNKLDTIMANHIDQIRETLALIPLLGIRIRPPIVVVTPIRSTTSSETPSSGCTRSPDEISTNEYSSKIWAGTFSGEVGGGGEEEERRRRVLRVLG
ncbi:hypothetical protein F511_18506 [Dorcoceras hygrometricum]|uniref:Uncharacterized protein n=1 Tax=Dorcoceras hygrometricum TaxID=472368 RepID=A0A2Z7AUH9_9LAMI|nr:hypothetical protein F511_18506 [Dorcoceras hygrometricum]